jgi:hypothetical protein
VTDLPFRWNLARREQLGSLVEGPPAALGSIVNDIRECCARVVAMAGDSELVFVGRSPESLYDYLSGAFAGTGWEERAVLLNLSMRDDSAEEVERANPEALQAIHRQLRALLRRRRPRCATGTTWRRCGSPTPCTNGRASATSGSGSPRRWRRGRKCGTRGCGGWCWSCAAADRVGRDGAVTRGDRLAGTL